MGKLRTPSPSMMVALVALFVALGGTGYAASQSGSGHAKTARVTTSSVNKRVSKLVRRLSALRRQIAGLGQTGPQGTPGLQGPKGDKGDKGDPAAPATVTVRQGGPLTAGANGSGPGCVDGTPGGSKGFRDAGDTLVSCGGGAGGSAKVVVDCAPGEVATGGGYTYADGKRHALVVKSAPSPDSPGQTPTGWQVKVETLTNDSSNNTPVTPYAVCMKP